MTHTTDERRAELWVNTPADSGYELLVDHLDRLEAAGTIDDYVVYHWGHDLDVSSDRLRSAEDQLARERIAAFKQWAQENDCTVAGLGERVTAGVGRMGPEYTAEHLPPVLLAEYVGDDLEQVTPCSGGAEHVVERLETLGSTDDATLADSPPSTATTTEPDTATGSDPALTRPSRWTRLVRRLR
ncbi:hypothetical protein SAMN04487948_102220 [Halogranum amylolyticum]|uniref:Uncharacterized protein n=1 Tax=Halogranum amylolyticum TaxID=660520 RepID=A0A1H8PCL6_9EURY|nr:HTH domain-containing protein [Halogranum amylolyticum]SEO39517.1 hypothetical protein SAMN04487948_102220 [Halogranum amylolyticum]